MKKSSKKFDIISLGGALVVGVLVLSIGIIVGFGLGRLGGGQLSTLTEQDFSLYWDVYKLIKDEYAIEEAIDDEEMYYGTIKGMVDSLDDPATVFLTPDETEAYDLSKSGTYEGIGAELGYKDNVVVVVSPLAGSPAELAGLKPGDVILKVDGEEITNKSVYDAVGMIRGEAGTKVTLSISRKMNGTYKQMDIVITRGSIDSPSMDIKEIKNGIAHVRVYRFTEESLEEWENLWDSIATKLAAQNVKGIVLDLRNNPGGYLSAAVYMAEEFLPKGKIVAIQRGRNEEDQYLRVQREGKLQKVPMVILVNEGSASASEIFAGAIQVYSRAPIMGTATYGKGTAQTIVDLDEGSSLHLTIMKWLLPDEGWINPENPIKPDIEVEFDDDGFLDGEDNQLEEAIKQLSN